MSRVQFGIAQFVGISVAEALIPSHALNAERRTLLVAGVTLAFGFLALIAVRDFKTSGGVDNGPCWWLRRRHCKFSLA